MFCVVVVDRAGARMVWLNRWNSVLSGCTTSELTHFALFDLPITLIESVTYLDSGIASNVSVHLYSNLTVMLNILPRWWVPWMVETLPRCRCSSDRFKSSPFVGVLILLES